MKKDPASLPTPAGSPEATGARRLAQPLLLILGAVLAIAICAHAQTDSDNSVPNNRAVASP